MDELVAADVASDPLRFLEASKLAEIVLFSNRFPVNDDRDEGKTPRRVLREDA